MTRITRMNLAHRRLTPNFTFIYVSGGGMNCVSCGMCVYRDCFVYVLSLGYSSSPELLELAL